MNSFSVNFESSRGFLVYPEILKAITKHEITFVVH
jgi:hypothetical protein